MVADVRGIDELLSVERDQVRFWERFGFGRSGPDFTGMKVLDVGCGEGMRCVEMAGRGARMAVGIDPYQDQFCTAHANLILPTHITQALDFRKCSIHDLDEGDFDVVVSENALEHIMDVPDVLASIRRVLKPGGRAYFGFGPLYHSPFGDHGWMSEALPGGRSFRLPWAHLLFPERWLFKRMEKVYGKPVRSTADWPFLALNKTTAAEFRQLFHNSGMRVIQGSSNANFGWKGKLFGAASKIPLLDRYFTLGLYYVLEK